jgi:type IV secretory pathway VirB10-like protein
MADPDKVVEQKIPPPTGSLSDKTKTRIMVGIALFSIIAIFFTGGSAVEQVKTVSTRDEPKPAPAGIIKAAEENKDKRIRDEQRQKEDLGREVQILAAQPPDTDSRGFDSRFSRSGRERDEERQSPVERDKEKRAYLASIASNVVANPREGLQFGLPPAATKATTGRYRQPVDRTEPEELKEPETPEEQQPEKVKLEKKTRPSAKEGEYTIAEGTIIPCVLSNRLNGSFAGPVICQVSVDVYSRDRERLIIPIGSTALGTAKRVTGQNQSRLEVGFHRLMFPDGRSLDLADFIALDQPGATALKDKTNRHLASTFGTSLVLGLAGALTLWRSGSVYNDGGSAVLGQGAAQQLGQDANRVLQQGQQRLPEITIREGTRVNIHVGQDIHLPAYRQTPVFSDEGERQ